MTDWPDFPLTHTSVPYAIAVGNCRWCWHPWHGLPCSTSSACCCESSLTSRDDSWRPWTSSDSFDDRVATVMHDTGCDGWAARLACVAHSYPYRVRKVVQLKDYLYGADLHREAA